MNSPLLDKIRSRGYWEVIIRPANFKKDRIPDINNLLDIVRQRCVKIRGWDFPHFDMQEASHIDLDWVGQELEWQHFLSAWRFYQSGLFVHIAGNRIDWRDQSNFWRADLNWQPNNLFGVADSLFIFHEVFEFAARLSLSEAGDDTMFVSISACNIAKRKLYLDDAPAFGYIQPYISSLQNFPYSLQISKSELVSKPIEFALVAASELFKRFGWRVNPDDLRSIHDRILKR